MIPSFSFFLFSSYNNNNDSNGGSAPWSVIQYKIKIIKRDKNAEAIDVNGGGVGDGAAPLPNIIPKKLPSSLGSALPVVVVPVPLGTVLPVYPG